MGTDEVHSVPEDGAGSDEFAGLDPLIMRYVAAFWTSEIASRDERIENLEGDVDRLQLQHDQLAALVIAMTPNQRQWLVSLLDSRFTTILTAVQGVQAQVANAHQAAQTRTVRGITGWQYRAIQVALLAVTVFAGVIGFFSLLSNTVAGALGIVIAIVAASTLAILAARRQQVQPPQQSPPPQMME